MGTPARNALVNDAIQVTQQVNDGLTVTDACREVGIPRSTFYYTIKANPDAIAEFQDMVAETNRKKLGMILLSRIAILDKLIKDGLADTTKPRDRLNILKTLDKLLDDLANKLQVDNEAEIEAQEFMRQGAVISRQVSRMTAGTTDIGDEN